MKERDYIKATNRVKVSAALTILRDVLAGDEYGITANELSHITSKLRRAEEKLFTSYEIFVAGKIKSTMQSDHARLKMQNTLKKINMELGEFIKPQPAHICHFETSLADGETKICKCGNVE